jgi:hypothetical protein
MMADHPHKRIFSRPDFAADLIRLVCEDCAQELDFDTLDRSHLSFITDDRRDQEDDIIWRLRWQGRDLYIYLLIASQPDPDIPVRIMHYVSLLYQDIRRSGTIGSLEPLPPVLPVVLYSGAAPWQTPLDIHEAIGPVPTSIKRHQPALRYILIDETRVAFSPHVEDSNLAAAVLMLAQIAPNLRSWFIASKREDQLAEFLQWRTRNPSPRSDLPADLNALLGDAPFAEHLLRQSPMTYEGGRHSEATIILNAIHSEVADGHLEPLQARAIIRDFSKQGLLPHSLAEQATQEAL